MILIHQSCRPVAASRRHSISGVYMQFRHHGFSVLALASALLVSTAGSARSQSASPPTISTTATGETKVVPDHATIELSVQTRAPSATAAVGENADKQTKVIAAISRLGIETSRISTQRYSVTPETRNDKVDQTPMVVSYFVSNTIIVDVSDIGLVGKILDSAINAGANDVGSVSMYARDTQDAYQKALSAAVVNARSAATTIAAAAGGRLGPLINLSSNSTNWPSPIMKMSRMASLDAVQTPISAGEQTLTASVSASWVFIQNH